MCYLSAVCPGKRDRKYRLMTKQVNFYTGITHSSKISSVFFTCCASSVLQAPWHCGQQISWNRSEDNDESSCQNHSQCWALEYIPWTFFGHENQYLSVYASLSVEDLISCQQQFPCKSL
jgi:hypothetical protein